MTEFFKTLLIKMQAIEREKMDFTGIWKTEKGNLVKVAGTLKYGEKEASDFYVGVFYLYNEEFFDKPGFSGLTLVGKCLIAPDGKIIIGGYQEQLTYKKRSEEDKNWPTLP